MRKRRKETIRIQRINFDFISRISHALRTPLCITREGISLVLDKIPGQINRKQEEILVTARDNIDRLNRTLCKLLKAYKIESQRERKARRARREV